MTLYRIIKILQSALDLMGDDEVVFIANGKQYEMTKETTIKFKSEKSGVGIEIEIEEVNNANR